MLRRRTCAILRELKVPDEICLRYVTGAKIEIKYTSREYINKLELEHVGAALIF
jgi:hypothetical protein